MKAMLLEMMKTMHGRGFIVGRDTVTIPRDSGVAWRDGGLMIAESLIRLHAKELGIETRDIPTEPGLYWIETIASSKVNVMVEVYKANALDGMELLRMRVVGPDLGHSWMACTPDDPRVVRYLGRVNMEPVPMASGSG